jgi:hypothetical protein
MIRARNEVHNGQDIIDSRDVIRRIRELQDYRDDAAENPDDQDMLTAADGRTFASSVDFGEDEYNELKALEKLEEEASGSPDWNHGETLIRDSYFEEYAQQLAEDIGAIDKNASWPNDHIDWEAAADALKADYMSADFDGVEYWIRA